MSMFRCKIATQLRRYCRVFLPICFHERLRFEGPGKSGVYLDFSKTHTSVFQKRGPVEGRLSPKPIKLGAPNNAPGLPLHFFYLAPKCEVLSKVTSSPVQRVFSGDFIVIESFTSLTLLPLFESKSRCCSNKCSGFRESRLTGVQRKSSTPAIYWANGFVCNEI